MTANRQPTSDELNGVKQDTVQWPAKAHRATIVDSDGNEDPVIETDSVLNGHVCTDNSSVTPLAGDATFTGIWQDTLNYNCIIIGIIADQVSATDGLKIQWSSDGVSIHDDDVFTLGANRGKVFTFSPARRYIRIVYTNGSTPQTSFNLQTIFKKGGFKPSSHRIQDSIVEEDDAELVKAVLTGENPAGTFVNFQSTTAGNFKISLEELENGVSVNSNSQLKTTSFHSDGTAGQLITGVDYASGKSGIDPSTETIVNLDYEHHEIHEGDHYNYCDYDTSVALNGIIRFIMVTPNTSTWIHFTFNVSASGGATIELFEASSGISGGTAITPRNNNRNSLNTSTVTLTKDPTVTTEGTRAAGYLAGGDRTAGAAMRTNEYILKQNTAYLVKITSLGADNQISWCAEWYEHVSLN